MRRVGDGVLTTLEVETFSTTPSGASDPFEVASGGGLVVALESKRGDFRSAALASGVPGAVTVAQHAPGHGTLIVRLWRPLPAGEKDLFLRLPPCPNGTWSYQAGDPAPSRVLGNGVEAGPAEAGTFRGDTPPDGRLHLSWGEGAGEGVKDLVAETLVEIRLDETGARFRGMVRGYTRRSHQALGLPEALAYEPPEHPPREGAARVQVAGGALELIVPGARSDRGRWFRVAFEGQVDLQEGRARVGPAWLPACETAPRRAAVRVVPVLSRSYEVRGPTRWDMTRLPRGVQEWGIREPEGPTELELRVKGRVVPAPDRAAVSRLEVHTVPVESTELPTLRSTLSYRVSSPGTLRLRAPAGMPMPQRGVVAGRSVRLRQQAGEPGIYMADFPQPGTFLLEVDHSLSAALSPEGTMTLEVPAPEGPVELLSWSGRVPEGLAFLGVEGEASSAWRRDPFPIRWMRSLFDGLGSVLTEARTPLVLGLAGMLAAYAYLFMVPPNRQAAYVLSAMLAAVAVASVLWDAARPARLPPERGGAVVPHGVEGLPLISRVREAWSQLPGLVRGGGSGDPALVHAHDHPPATSSHAAERPPPSNDWVRVPADPREVAARAAAARGAPRGGVNAEEEEVEVVEDDFEILRVETAPRLTLRVMERRVLPLIAALAALVVMGVLAACRLVAGPAPFLGAGVVVLLLVPFELRFPADAMFPTLVLLAMSLGATFERVFRVGSRTWDRVQRELEERRTRALRQGGFPGAYPEEGMPRGPLKKNEVTYEEVFDESPAEEEADDGEITFLVGEPSAEGNAEGDAEGAPAQASDANAEGAPVSSSDSDASADPDSPPAKEDP